MLHVWTNLGHTIAHGNKDDGGSDFEEMEHIVKVI